MRIFFRLIFFCGILVAVAHAGIFSRIRGVVHDPQHRPLAGATVTLRSVSSAYRQSALTKEDGVFAFAGVPLGEYRLSVQAKGFEPVTESVTLSSGIAPVLHLQLKPAAVKESVAVTAQTFAVDTATTTTLVTREQIAETPGADYTNSMAMITDYVPAAYMAHDMLHIRGGHQTGWQIDGVPIPNTNIASNVGPQIDPKDIDAIEISRGSYTADEGDRTYAIFNIVPRNGFERSREGELVLGAGSFLSTNYQLSLGDHAEHTAWYASLNGNRSDYGLSTPIEPIHHDAANGVGGFGSLLINRSPRDQYRVVGQFRNDFFQIPYDPDPSSYGNTLFDTSALRDVEKERDGYLLSTWLHSFNPSTVLAVSPFYHFNSANYEPGKNDSPVATTSEHRSQYEGGQAGITTTLFGSSTLSAGAYGFAQQDRQAIGIAYGSLLETDSVNGSLAELYLSDNAHLRSWLTAIAGLRYSHFSSAITEDIVSPRFGLAAELPRLHWVLRAFYGRFYQPPPLVTASGPLIAYMTAQNTSLIPLKGERDEEQQFGLRIPYRGWTLDVDNFRTRANNFLDHSSIGESSLFYPVTVDGALIRGWELTLTSPELWKHLRAHLAYSNQIAEQRGVITGGLLGDAPCDTPTEYCALDHDQRNTLDVGAEASLPRRIYVSFNLVYGSGLSNGDPGGEYPGDYLPAHTTADLSVGRHFNNRLSASINATNLGNSRVLIDNSQTFGGLHYNDPRQIYGELRYRFHF